MCSGRILPLSSFKNELNFFKEPEVFYIVGDKSDGSKIHQYILGDIHINSNCNPVYYSIPYAFS